MNDDDSDEISDSDLLALCRVAEAAHRIEQNKRVLAGHRSSGSTASIDDGDVERPVEAEVKPVDVVNEAPAKKRKRVSTKECSDTPVPDQDAGKSRASLERESRTASPEKLRKNECLICMDSVADTVFDPCGHFTCASCSASFKRKPCPICRVKVKKSIRVFFP
eukprot:TRINITY_DN69462_c0_g1_i1.p1 TRINITY_DN69462_c0_g1~~TRINITY_DN69462_c0_g1_i1.p1  ORF type:complete len:174 (-),score=22.99 TRINITY_DN69462_c0_g1_i1:190-681(-)